MGIADDALASDLSGARHFRNLQSTRRAPEMENQDAFVVSE
jgi:hypothetical protein